MVQVVLLWYSSSGSILIRCCGQSRQPSATIGYRWQCNCTAVQSSIQYSSDTVSSSTSAKTLVLHPGSRNTHIIDAGRMIAQFKLTQQVSLCRCSGTGQFNCSQWDGSPGNFIGHNTFQKGSINIPGCRTCNPPEYQKRSAKPDGK